MPARPQQLLLQPLDHGRRGGGARVDAQAGFEARPCQGVCHALQPGRTQGRLQVLSYLLGVCEVRPGVERSAVNRVWSVCGW